jgi:uncharacterized protein (TIGR02246 family)
VNELTFEREIAMTKKILTSLICLVLFSAPASASEVDEALILETLESWAQGWAHQNAEMAVSDYADDADWTNAFGDRFRSKAELQKGLEFIFGLDFVMAGESDGHQFNDMTFLNSDIALVRSKLVRTNQRTSSGQLMPDRHINHLRVYERRSGRWLIVSHMISQEQRR